MEEEEQGDGPPEFRGSTGLLIKKVREECKKYQRSAVMNDELQSLALESGCGLKLVLDVKSRWNSTVRMLRNFISLEKPLRQFYGEPADQEPDIGLFPFSVEELNMVKELCSTLAVVEKCVLRLSLADATLMSADVALQVGVSI